jgi:hypothetical protein
MMGSAFCSLRSAWSQMIAVADDGQSSVKWGPNNRSHRDHDPPEVKRA